MNELVAAGILDSELQKSYSECKRLNALHGKTYYLATLLLPKNKRPFVHALYGFARYADEIVDNFDSNLSNSQRRSELEQWSFQMLNDLKSGTSTDFVGRALVDTVNRFDISIAYFEAFLHSMAMDLDVVEYANFDALSEYVYGSAAVIGLQMVEILGMKKGEEENTRKAAEKLGIAFQLANFIRDVGEDLERGRIYLPMDELAAFNIDREMLERKIVTPQLKLALKDQIERVRKLQSEANAGIKNLSPDSRPCIEAASELYCGIVDEVEKIDFQIFNKRAKTSTLRRIRVALPAWLRAVKAR